MKDTKAENNQIDLRKIFLGLQDQMVTQLTTGRENITHPGTKGNVSELCWIEMLATYLPNRYDVKSAFAVDCKGHISEQIDIVIFDRQFSPFLLNQNGVFYVPAESVYCVIEVKQSLNKGAIEYAAEKAASVRRLHRTNAPFRHLGGISKLKRHFGILAGILTLDSAWNPPLGDPLKSCLSKLSKESQLQLGCALQCGSFAYAYAEDGKQNTMISTKETSLIYFFLNLLSVLQSYGSAPAMDIPEWSKVL